MLTIVDKRAKLDCIGFDLTGMGELATRFAKADFLPDGKVATRGQPHRFVLTPSYSLEASLDYIDQMVAGITPHLASEGYSPPNEADVELLKGIGRLIWTPELIQRRREFWTNQSLPEFLIPQYEQITFNVRFDESIAAWLEHERLSLMGIEVKTEDHRRMLEHVSNSPSHKH